MVGLPLQAAVVGLECLFVAAFLVQNLTHDGIKVCGYLLVALRRNLSHTTTEHIKSLVCFSFLVVGDAEEIVEHHLVGGIFQSGQTEVDDALGVVSLQSRLYQL